MNNKKIIATLLISLLILITIFIDSYLTDEHLPVAIISKGAMTHTNKINDINIHEPDKQSAITSSNEQHQTDDYIVSCGNWLDANGHHVGPEQAQIDNVFNNENLLSDSLKDSNSLNHQIGYSLIHAFSKDTENSKVDYLNSLTNTKVKNKFLNWSLLDACTNDYDNPVCHNIEEQVVEEDGDNGSVWLNVAALRINQNNIDGAIDALNIASSSAYFDEYYNQSFAILDESFLSIGINSLPLRLFASFGINAADEIGGVFTVLNFCNEQAVKRADVASACINISNRVFNDASSNAYKYFGLAIQKRIYENLNETSSLERVNNQLSKLSASLFPEQYFKALGLMMHDDEFANYFKENVVGLSENEAMESIIKEAIRLSSDKNYNPCKIEQKEGID